MQNYLLPLIILFFVACSSQPNEATVAEVDKTLIDSLTIESTLAYRAHHSGMFIDKTIDKPVYYTSNAVSQKEIQLFNAQGNYQKSISLKEAFQYGSEILALEVVSPDTVVVLMRYINQVLFMNSKGAVWKKIDLNTLLPKFKLFTYEAISSGYSKLIYGNSLILGLYLEGGDEHFSHSQEDFEKLYVKQWASPQLMKIDNIYSDSASFTKGFALYKDIYPSDSFNLIFEFKSFLVKDSSVLLTSIYSDQLYEIDLNSLTLREKHRLTNKAEPFLPQPISLIDDDKPYDLFHEVRKLTGNYYGMYHNPYLDHLYIVFIRKLPQEFSFKKSDPIFQTIILVYDSELNKIKELEVDGTQYAGLILPSPNGVFIQKRESFINRGETPIVLHEFNY